MKRVLTAIAVVAITAAPAMADLELIKGRFYQKGEYTDQVFTLKNDTKRIIKHVTAKCGVFENEELIDTGDLDFENVPPGGEGYDRLSSVGRGNVTRIDCQIKSVE